jgi:hypothetical protein
MNESFFLQQQDPKSLSIDQLISRLNTMEVELESTRKAKNYYINLYQQALSDPIKIQKLIDRLMEENSRKSENSFLGQKRKSEKSNNSLLSYKVEVEEDSNRLNKREEFKNPLSRKKDSSISVRTVKLKLINDTNHEGSSEHNNSNNGEDSPIMEVDEHEGSVSGSHKELDVIFRRSSNNIGKTLTAKDFANNIEQHYDHHEMTFEVNESTRILGDSRVTGKVTNNIIMYEDSEMAEINTSIRIMEESRATETVSNNIGIIPTTTEFKYGSCFNDEDISEVESSDIVIENLRNNLREDIDSLSNNNIEPKAKVSYSSIPIIRGLNETPEFNIEETPVKTFTSNKSVNMSFRPKPKSSSSSLNVLNYKFVQKEVEDAGLGEDNNIDGDEAGLAVNSWEETTNTNYIVKYWNEIIHSVNNVRESVLPVLNYLICLPVSYYQNNIASYMNLQEFKSKVNVLLTLTNENINKCLCVAGANGKVALEVFKTKTSKIVEVINILLIMINTKAKSVYEITSDKTKNFLVIAFDKLKIALDISKTHAKHILQITNEKLKQVFQLSKVQTGNFLRYSNTKLKDALETSKIHGTHFIQVSNKKLKSALEVSKIKGTHILQYSNLKLKDAYEFSKVKAGVLLHHSNTKLKHAYERTKTNAGLILQNSNTKLKNAYELSKTKLSNTDFKELLEVSKLQAKNVLSQLSTTNYKDLYLTTNTKVQNYFQTFLEKTKLNKTDLQKVLVAACSCLSLYIIYQYLPYLQSIDITIVVLYGSLILGIVIGYLLYQKLQEYKSRNSQIAELCFDDIKIQLLSRHHNGEFDPCIVQGEYINAQCEKYKITKYIFVKFILKKIRDKVKRDNQLIEATNDDMNAIWKLNNIIIV